MKEAIVFVVTLKEGNYHDFMRVFKTRERAINFMRKYTMEYENIGDGLVMFEEILT